MKDLRAGRKEHISNYYKRIKDSKIIPPESKVLLSPSFSLPLRSFDRHPLYHLIAETETILKTAPDKTTQERTRCNITNVIQNYVNNKHSDRSSDVQTKFLTQACTTTTKFLKSNPGISVLPADKGNKTVIMWTDDYEQKMQELLIDDKTYRRIRSDPTNRKLPTTTSYNVF